MRPRSSRTLHGVLLCLALLAWGTAARATVQVDAAILRMPGIGMEQVQLRLEHDEQGRLRLRLSAARADVQALGWHRVGIDIDGVLTRGAGNRWLLDGAFKLHGAPGGLLSDGHLRLAMEVDANNLQVDLRQGNAVASAALPLDQPTHAQITLEKLPLRWLQGLLAQVWSGHVTGGRIGGTLALDIDEDGIRSSGELAVSGAGFDSPDGSLAGQGLDARGRLTLDTGGDSSRVDVDIDLHGGEVLLGPLYARLPEHDVHFATSMLSAGHGTELRNLRFNDPDALHLDGALVLGANGGIESLYFPGFSVRLPAAYQRYGKAWLATMGLEDLDTRGFVNGSVTMTAGKLRAFAFDAHDVGLADGSNRFALGGLNGGLDWHAGETRPATTLAWNELRFYKVSLGAADSRWRSQDGTLRLQSSLDMPMFGGHLLINSLQWRPEAEQSQRLQTSLALTGVDVGQLTKAFDWPRFTGTLAGAMPGLTYTDDHFVLQGGLTLHVFDGFIDVTRLSLQHPFGATPVLAGDIDMRQLDLAALTSVFDFGNITGRMDGKVHDLRMVGWSPVAFKASLLAGKGGRISQRAVNNLTSVGGGGMAAGLQGAVLKLFDSFGYRRIGLGCTLQGSVCSMSGLEPADGGYLIVEGRGLPHLSVIGHQHEVSWPTLIDRLKTAVTGKGPVIE